ncbi:lipopolysaccharide biosynthesis protein [Aureimonas sp. AU12]|uniref:lipopolysaccharide biosynthesis protein n=1 Tax=Aureimonas sp. AU12 TaxID=1638161 RepID=UPI000AEC7E7B|nr:lipopolysaccharide biosynthesis protein [Aureimonas sp. AU12]
MRFVSIAHLLTGNFVASLFALVAFTLSARALGVEQYGELALMLAFTRVIERIISFQSWQTIIRFGAGLQDEGRIDDFRALLKFGFLLDLGAAVSAWLVAIGLAYAAAPLFGWSADAVQLLMLFSTVLLFQLSGLPNAVLRLAGRFNLLAYGQLVNLAFRVVLCLVGITLALDIRYFALVWAGTQIIGSLTFLALAFRTLHRQGIHRVFSAPLKGVTRRFPGLWNFAFSSNLSLTLWVSSQELDTLLVGLLADPASAGLYHIAKRIGRIGQQVGGQVQSVLYPDVARLWRKGLIDEFARVILQVEIFLLGFGVLGVIVIAVIAHPLLLWTAGPEFMGAAPLLVLQMIGVGLSMAGSASRSGLLAMGHQRDVLVVVAIATAGFHLTALALIPIVGAMGGNIANIVFGCIWAVGLGLTIHRALKLARLPSLSIASTRAEPAGLAAEGI